MAQINLEDLLKNVKNKTEKEFREYIRQEANRIIAEQFSGVVMNDAQKSTLHGMVEDKILAKLLNRVSDDIWSKLCK